MVDRKANWTYANDLCQMYYQTSLTTIINKESDDSAISQCNVFCNTKEDCGCWIGAYRRATETSWNWIDHSALSTYGFYSDHSADYTSAPWHPNNAPITTNSNAYVAYVPFEKSWRWRECDGGDNIQFYPLCFVRPHMTTTSNPIVPITSSHPIKVTKTTESVFKSVKPVEFGNDMYIALLVVIFGLLCIVGTVLFYKQKTEKKQIDIYKIPKKEDESYKPDVVALARPRPRPGVNTILSQSHDPEYSSDGPSNGDDGNTMAVMSDINSVNIEDDEVLEIRQWLTDQVQLGQYLTNFVENGYEKMEFIQDISTKNELHEIGVTKCGHQVRLIKQIQLLQNAPDPRQREITILLSETKHEDIEEEEHHGAVKQYKKKHLNHQYTSKTMTYLSSLHITDDWQLEHGRIRSDESLSVSSMAAKGQHPEDRTDGMNVNVDFLDDSTGKVTAGFIVEDSPSDDSHKEALLMSPTPLNNTLCP
eukprot:372461_1